VNDTGAPIWDGGRGVSGLKPSEIDPVHDEMASRASEVVEKPAKR
jgi:hypothetical protein